jgi:hypothetical protein
MSLTETWNRRTWRSKPNQSIYLRRGPGESFDRQLPAETRSELEETSGNYRIREEPHPPPLPKPRIRVRVAGTAVAEMPSETAGEVPAVFLRPPPIREIPTYHPAQMPPPLPGVFLMPPPSPATRAYEPAPPPPPVMPPWQPVSVPPPPVTWNCQVDAEAVPRQL